MSGDEATHSVEFGGDRGTKYFPPAGGVILGVTSVYKCDKGLFARGF